MTLTVRLRLTLWNALALAVVLVGFALAVYGLVARTLYRQVDRGLVAALEQLERDDRLAGGGDRRFRYWTEEFW